MDCCRAVIICALVGCSFLSTSALAKNKEDSKPLTADNLIELVRSRGDFKAAWGSMFKGEYTIPEWLGKLEANSVPVSNTSINGKDYVFGSMCKANDCANERIIALFSSDHRKAWALYIQIPAGIGADGAAHPKNYANLHYYGTPDLDMKKNLMGLLEKDPAWK